MTLVLGTRGSKLALWQATYVQHLLADCGIASRIEVVHTSGDADATRPLAALEGRGVFTTELEAALLDGSIDAAVHSLKDLPTTLAEGLIIAATPRRGPVRDTLVPRDPAVMSLELLVSGATVGTSSIRRSAQLRAVRADLHICSIRGNVPTRIEKVRGGELGLDATILAEAGLHRLGLEERGYPLDPMTIMPAPGQGAIAVEVRADGDLGDRLAAIEDADTATAVRAERSMLRELQGGCRAPIAAYTMTTPAGPRLYGRVIAGDGSVALTASQSLDLTNPERSGAELAASLLNDGAASLIAAARSDDLKPSELE